MEDQLISFETAKLARDKGWDIVTDKAFNPNTGKAIKGNVIFHLLQAEPDLSKHTFRPTQSLLQKWLREVHKIHVNPEYAAPDTNRYNYRIDAYSCQFFGESSERFDTYEEALEAGLQHALKLI